MTRVRYAVVNKEATVPQHQPGDRSTGDPATGLGFVSLDKITKESWFCLTSSLF